MSEPENKSPAIPDSPQPENKFQTVKFVHERSPQFRTYHADGIWGVVAGNNDIHVNFFTEYPRPATGVINPVNPKTGNYTGEYELLGVSDPNYLIMIREFQNSVVLSIASAQRVHTILGSLIEAAKKQQADQQARAQIK